MRQFEAEFESARALQGWPAVIELFKDLLVVAGIEETSDGAPDGMSKELAEYRNRMDAGNMAAGKKI